MKIHRVRWWRYLFNPFNMSKNRVYIPVGDVLEYGGKYFKCIEQPEFGTCLHCDLVDRFCACNLVKCGWVDREDGSVIFKKLEVERI